MSTSSASREIVPKCHKCGTRNVKIDVKKKDRTTSLPTEIIYQCNICRYSWRGAHVPKIPGDRIFQSKISDFFLSAAAKAFVGCLRQ